MMTKQSFIAFTAIILTVGFVAFLTSNSSNPNSTDYELLAVTDHEKLTSGGFSIRMNEGNSLENTSVHLATKQTRLSVSALRNMLAPAINAAPIAKFLNGNLPTTTPNTNVPNLLSQTGAFANLGNLTPNQGLIPYDMIEPFWSDGASKRRWMAIPNDGTHDTPEEQIQFSMDDAWDFPRGAVLIKHFELGGKRLETRFEVKGDDDVYYYLTYKWNDAQTDATLLDEAVDEDVVVDGVTQSWHYPSRNECASCHFPQNGSVLGPKTRNLNKAIVYPSSGVQMNQLVNLSELGILAENITNSNVGTYPAVAAKNDLSASLEDRARSYIDVNCASCHNPQVDNVAMFDARYSTPLENQNIIYGDVIYDEGLNNPKVIIPQDVSNSMMHFRMNSTQTGIEMPPLAKDVVDTKGVQLIADWINSLTPATSAPPVAVISASPVNGVAPLSVNFDATASTDADDDTLTFNWDFGDGTTGQGSTIDHVYNSPGSYTASLTANDGQQSDETTVVIVVNDSDPGGNTVSFTDGTSLIGQNNFSGLPMGVIDMNGDGKDDIVQFNAARNLRIQYQNSVGQTFSTYSYGQVSSRNQWSTAIADFDQNGYNDILSGGAYDNLKIITNNNGNNSFSLATLPSSNIFIQGSNFVDINNDGWADIFACHDDAESRAYQNNQNGTFSFNANLISTETDPTSDNSGNYASMWIDYDNDRDLDLYISKCRGGVTSSSDPRRINMLWQNDGNNNFTEVAAQANLKIGAQTWLSDFGDIDNDGDLDAIVINHGTGPNLMRNNGNGTFTEITSGSGLLPTLEPQDYYGIQGFFRDFNNDGHLDLMVSGDNHYIFYNNGDGTFQNAANPFNSNQIQSFSVGDLNHDGFLDIYAGYANGLNSPSSTRDRIWLNQGNSNNFLNIQLRGTQSNINGIGARVEIYGAWGMQIRDVRSGEGYGLVNSFTQHFGIGVNTLVDKVVVRWPSGIVDEILNPAINQFLNIVEGEDICATTNVTPEYSINGTTDSGANEITINEGDELILSLAQAGNGYRITLPNGSIVENEYTIDNVTSSDAGSYIFTTSSGCTATLNIDVQDPCPQGSVVPEYTVNGITNNGDSEITIYEGDALSLGLVSSTGTFTITLPNGTQVQNGWSIGSVTEANEGTYTFTTESDCTASLNIVIEDPCPAGSVVPEYIINGTTDNGTNEITVDEGDAITLGLASNTAAFTITLPNGSQVQNGYSVASVAPSDQGLYTFTTELGCSATLNIIVIEDPCPVGSVVPEYTINGTTDSGTNEITIDEGDSLSLGLVSGTGTFTITLPDGSEVQNGYSVSSVAPNNEGVYTFTTESGCTATLNIIVIEDPCPAGSVVPEYTINGTTDSGTNEITIDEGDSLSLGLVSGTGNFTITLPNGSEVQNGYSIGSAAQTDEGTYSFTTEQSCTATLSIIVNAPVCPAQGTPCDDGDPNTTNDVADGNCNCSGTPVGSGTELCVGISYWRDDVEEYEQDGNVYHGSTDLEMVTDEGIQTIGLRFNDITVPQGAVIQGASIQFTADEANIGPTALVFRGEAADNASQFATTTNNVTARNTTNASISWNPPAWNIVGEAGTDQKSPDLKTIVQEIVNRTGFTQGNSIVFIISGSGKRVAESFEGSAQGAPKLCITYTNGADCPAGSVVPEYTVNGTTGSGESEITIEEGDTLSLDLASGTFTITLPNGSEVQNGYSISSTAQADEGTYTFTTEQGCTATLSVIVNAACPAQGTPCDDGDPNTTNDMEDGDCNCAGTPVDTGTEICVGISYWRDDVEEYSQNGNVYHGSTDLEMVIDNSYIGGVQTIGLRFNNIAVPRGAVIQKASIQFTADETNTEATSLVFRGEAIDDAPQFATTTNNLTARIATNASISWNPPAWNTEGEAGTAQKSPDLATIVQEIVDRQGFVPGNSIAFIISGSGKRVAESFEGSPQGAPRLCITYSGGNSSSGLVARVDQDILTETVRSNDVVLYPNPTAGTLYLDLKNYEEIALSCTIFSSSQQMVYETYFDQDHMRIERLDLDNLADGLYTLVIRSRNGSRSKIIIVKK